MISPPGSQSRTTVESLVLHATLDESGKFSDKDIIAACGFLTTRNVWNAYNLAWSEFLIRSDIEYLHVSELMRWDGIYAPKKDTLGAHGRDLIFTEAVKTICSVLPRRSVPIAVVLDAKAFRSLDSESRRRLGKPNLIVFQLFIGSILGYIARTKKDYVLSLVCDDDETMAGQLYLILCKSKVANPDAKRRIRSICFTDDTIYYPLQAADLFSHICYSEMERQMNHQTRPVAELYRTLWKAFGEFEGAFINSEHLSDISAPIPRAIDLRSTFPPLDEGPR